MLRVNPAFSSKHSEGSLEQPYVRVIALDRWPLGTGKRNMICKGCVIRIRPNMNFFQTAMICTETKYEQILSFLTVSVNDHNHILRFLAFSDMCQIPVLDYTGIRLGRAIAQITHINLKSPITMHQMGAKCPY